MSAWRAAAVSGSRRSCRRRRGRLRGHLADHGLQRERLAAQGGEQLRRDDRLPQHADAQAPERAEVRVLHLEGAAGDDASPGPRAKVVGRVPPAAHPALRAPGHRRRDRHGGLRVAVERAPQALHRELRCCPQGYEPRQPLAEPGDVRAGVAPREEERGQKLVHWKDPAPSLGLQARPEELARASLCDEVGVRAIAHRRHAAPSLSAAASARTSLEMCIEQRLRDSALHVCRAQEADIPSARQVLEELS